MNQEPPRAYSPLQTAPATGYNSGGVVQTTTTVTTTQPAIYGADHSLGKPWQVLTILTAILLALGAILILVGAALTTRDGSVYNSSAFAGDYHYNSIGILYIVGFALWFLASILWCISSAGGIGGNAASSKETNTGFLGYHHTLRLISDLLFIAATILLLIGACFFLATSVGVQYAGTILWIIGASLLVLSWFLRALAAYFESSLLYKNRPLNQADWNPEPSYVTTLTSNSFVTLSYLIAAVLLLLGAIAYHIRNNKVNYPNGTGEDGRWTFWDLAGILWIIAASIIILLSILQCVARR